MVTTHTVRFVNKTSSVWTLVVFVRLPSDAGLELVAFRQTRAAASAQKSVAFDDAPCICLGSHSGSGRARVYEDELIQAVAAGQAWKVLTQDGVQQFAVDGRSQFPGTLDVANVSGLVLDLGAGFASSAAVYQPNVPGSTTVRFTPTPSFWVFLSSEPVADGQVVALGGPAVVSSIFSGRLALDLSAQQPSATVTATMQGSGLVLQITYGGTT